MIIGLDASRAITQQRTGTEAYAYFLIRAFLPLAIENGHQVRLYYNERPSPDLFLHHPQIESIVIPFSRLWTHIRLAWELHTHPPDLFFTPAHVIPYTYRGRSIATIHDLGYHHFPEAHPKKDLAYLRWSTRHNGRISSHVLADSQATKEDLIRFDNINPGKVTVVYPGIDPNLLPVTDKSVITAVLQKYNITPPYLLHLSTIQPRKNLVRLVKAYAVASVPHQLVLAGKMGWLAQPILDAIAKLPSPVSNQIKLPGFIDDADKAALLSGATAVLYPSLYEGFGFPALEAQACETAVLCANSSSLPEIVADSALTIDPLNIAQLTTAIHKIATNGQLRTQLIKKGQQNVTRFNWTQTARQLLTLIES